VLSVQLKQVCYYRAAPRAVCTVGMGWQAITAATARLSNANAFGCVIGIWPPLLATAMANYILNHSTNHCKGTRKQQLAGCTWSRFSATMAMVIRWFTTLIRHAGFTSSPDTLISQAHQTKNGHMGVPASRLAGRVRSIKPSPMRASNHFLQVAKTDNA